MIVHLSVKFSLFHGNIDKLFGYIEYLSRCNYLTPPNLKLYFVFRGKYERTIKNLFG